MYCLINATTSLACSACTAPRLPYNGYCLCPHFSQEVTSSDCTAVPPELLAYIYEGMQGLILAAFIGQIILTVLRVGTPYGWRAWGFLQACTAIIATPAHKTSITAGIIKALYIPKGYYYLQQMYPGLQIRRNVNILLMLVVATMAFLLAYFLIERFWERGISGYIKGGWGYLAVMWLLLIGNQTTSIIAFNLQYATAIGTDQVGVIVASIFLLVGAAGLINSLAQFEPGTEPLSMLEGVSKIVNAGWILNLLITGFAPLLILKDQLPYLIFAVAAGLPLIWLGVSLLVEGYCLPTIIAVAQEILLWGLALLVVSLEVISAAIGLPICVGVALLVVLAEWIYLRVRAGAYSPVLPEPMANQSQQNIVAIPMPSK